MEKNAKTEICGLPKAEELRAAIAAAEGAPVREQLALLFDAGTFIELGAYTTRALSDFIATDKMKELEGVICGYGAIDGKLAFAFAEDVTRMGGMIDDRHAKKITDLYNLAIRNGAPVIGIFNVNGTDIFAGTVGLAAYGRIIAAVNRASGIVPQIAYVTGNCIGLCAAIAAMFDFTVKTSDAALYVASPTLTGADGAQDAILSYVGDANQCAAYIRSLISFLPMNASSGILSAAPTDNLNRMLGEIDFGGDPAACLSLLVDNGMYYEVGHTTAPEATTCFATVAGVKCGIVASAYSVDGGRLTALSARKIAHFVTFCDAFNIPLITLVDSMGLRLEASNDKLLFAPELAKLATAYASSDMPKVTVILGHAIGASFVLLGSKALGADVVYALDTAEIGALPADSGVAFAWDQYITLETTREALEAEWRATVSSPATAAASGEIDDVIGVSELRARICSAVLMLAAKDVCQDYRRPVLPL